MDHGELFFDHLLYLLKTMDVLKETALALDDTDDASIFRSVTTWILARLSEMNNYLYISIIQWITTSVKRVRDRERGKSKYILGAGVGMCVSLVLPGLTMLMIGAVTGVGVQWTLSTSGRIREPFIGFLEKLAWPVAGTLFGFWIFGIWGAITGGLLFCCEVDRYKTMVGALIGFTEEERDDLVSEIHSLTGSPETEDLTRFLSSQSNRKKLLRILFDHTEPSLPDPRNGSVTIDLAI
ncbi:uncharacterized protein [Haliotis asinina]|uniref:uncharacterized protein n=1 Tax=Haliotis asinina TaxID=109174 RepID=UPI003531B832